MERLAGATFTGLRTVNLLSKIGTVTMASVNTFQTRMSRDFGRYCKEKGLIHEDADAFALDISTDTPRFIKSWIRDILK